MSTVAPSAGRLLGSWALDPPIVGLLVTAAGLYLAGLARARSGRGRDWPSWRALSFAGGLLALAVALLSGVDADAQRWLSVHMLQHLMLLLLAPVLLLWAAPIRLGLRALPPRGRHVLGRMLASRATRLASRPAVGFGAFAVIVLGSHASGVFEVALRHPAVHALEHAGYLAAGLLLLAPLVGSDPLPRPPGAIVRFGWLSAAMIVMAVPGALLTFSPDVRYRFYLAPARALGASALGDQHLAGVIMWIGGGCAMFALALGVAMRAMIAEERRQRRRERHTTQAAGA